jgi:regulator of ribonuclease activity A
MKFSTTDLCDAHEKNITEGTLRALPPVFSHFGLQKRFFGQVVTLKCFEDNSLVKTELDQPGEGRVLMIDGGASVRCALVGGNIAASAARNLGIRALGLCPIRSIKRGQGELNVAVSVAGLRVVPGTWLYADADGVLLSDLPLL